jgi:hypothetical protein
VLGFSNRLRSDGIDAIIDQYVETPAEGWPRWFERNIDEADFVLMVCSELYALRVSEPEDDQRGTGVRWEGSLIYQYLYKDAGAKQRFVPVIFDKRDAKFIPPHLLEYTHYCYGTEDGYFELYQRITGQPSTVRPQLGKIKKLDVKSNVLQRISVFLCHSSKDKPAVRELYRKLSLNGAQPWLDEEDLLPGQEWEIEIPKAVRGADAVVVCLSKNAVTKAGYFHKEIAFALDVLAMQPENTIYLIPVKLEDCEVPDRLKHIHHVSITSDKGYEKLVTSLVARGNQLKLGNPTNDA